MASRQSGKKRSKNIEIDKKMIREGKKLPEGILDKIPKLVDYLNDHPIGMNNKSI
jgi:mRNA-degrading endonuclease RelE of RelBE toxin-antitoxin system